MPRHQYDTGIATAQGQWRKSLGEFFRGALGVGESVGERERRMSG